MTALAPGLAIVHGNRLEVLRDLVLDWTAAHPLAPLEEEIFLVQSNGAAEWLKMAIASARGVCAATRVELPGRFLWRAYRQQLGRGRVGAESPLDRETLTWRLMRLMPTLLHRAAYRPLADFLADGDPARRLQLARRLAELYDQYQVYRADWLDGWARGVATLPLRDGASGPSLPPEQRWQAELWRAILDDLGPDGRASTRPAVHRAFVAALEAGAPPAEPLPRRIVLFGASHVATQPLEALVALSTRMQVLLAIPNPCRYHWADIVDGREALGSSRHRRAARPGPDLATMPLDAMHRHAHPLLASWGRQGRDFMRLLDSFEDDAPARIALPRAECFDDASGTTLLEQAQAAIRDLAPLSEHPRAPTAATDRSIVFHVAHGAQREVEVLHDRLLELLADSDGALRPRDIVVMVPDVARFAPAIRAVFGQHDADDPRRIPFDIADLRMRGGNPLVVALEWLLRASDQRMRLQEVRDLLEVPAIAARFGLDDDAIATTFRWLADAGVRWGLHEDHRTDLGVGAAGAANTWRFGLDRLLLGYASGASDAFAEVEPYESIGGLESAALGGVVSLFDALDAWWRTADSDATPAKWAERARRLLAAFFAPTDERERLTIAALEAAIAAWLATCATADFAEPVPLVVLREAWLAGVDGLDASRRFLSGGVTFCTLTPLRAVPFEVVCLLGMDDRAFPRPPRRNDFDLTGDAPRPGDRSRRDDDRYLMLEALLSARRTLYVSWTGRSARDNIAEPPSVLVAQLRDYLDAGWTDAAGRSVVDARTTEHPLQPFGRRYFEDGGPVTFAREWRAAHRPDADAAPAVAVHGAPATSSALPTVTIDRLVRFVRNPVKDFFKTRLVVEVRHEELVIDDDEPFALDGLAQYKLKQRLVDAADEDDALSDAFGDDDAGRRIRRLVGAGGLPLHEAGTRLAAETEAVARSIVARRRAALDARPDRYPPIAVRFAIDAVVLDDAVDDLRSDGAGPVRIVATASKLTSGGKRPRVRARKLLDAWVTMLAASACGRPLLTVVVGCDATLTLAPLESDAARELLANLLATWTEGRREPLPFAAETALASLDGQDDAARKAYDGTYDDEGERRDFALARAYEDFEALAADGRFHRYAARLFEPLAAWAVAATVERAPAMLPASAEASGATP